MKDMALAYRTTGSAGEKKLSLQASSEARNERQLYDYQKVAVGTVIACLRAAVHVMQETDYSVPLERLAGMKTFWGLRKPPGLTEVMTPVFHEKGGILCGRAYPRPVSSRC